MWLLMDVPLFFDCSTCRDCQLRFSDLTDFAGLYLDNIDGGTTAYLKYFNSRPRPPSFKIPDVQDHIRIVLKLADYLR